VHLEHVPQNEGKSDHARPALERIAEILDVWVPDDIPLAPADDDQPHQAVEEDRQEDKGPFDQQQGGGAQAVDLIDPGLKGFRPVQDGGVGGQVDEHVAADGEQAQQRMEAANHELIPAKQGGRR
jgi:hypothetical protein